MRETITFLLFSLLTLHSFAQTRLTIRSADEVDFLLYMDDVQVNSVGCISITLDNVVKSKVTIRVDFPANTSAAFTQQLSLKKNTSVFYDIEASGTSYRLAKKSESTIAIKAEKKNTSLLSQSEGESSDDVEEEVEPENAKCPDSADDAAFNDLLVVISRERFESEKLLKMKQFISSECLTSAQLESLLRILAMEDNKMSLLNYSLHRIFDPSNLPGIEKNFYLEKNRRTVKALLEEI